MIFKYIAFVSFVRFATVQTGEKHVDTLDVEVSAATTAIEGKTRTTPLEAESAKVDQRMQHKTQVAAVASRACASSH